MNHSITKLQWFHSHSLAPTILAKIRQLMFVFLFNSNIQKHSIRTWIPTHGYKASLFTYSFLVKQMIATFASSVAISMLPLFLTTSR